MEYDVLCFTETHLDSVVYSSELFDSQYFTVHRRDRNLHGGGVLIAVRNGISHRAVSLNCDTEAVAIEFTEQKLLMFCIYKPPTCIDPDFLNFLEDCSGIEKSLLVGDFNFPGICWQTNPASVKPETANKVLHNKFVSDTLSLGYTQLVTDPTHVKGNTLDLLMTTHPGMVENLEIYPNSLSDHNIITFSIKCERSIKSAAKTTILLYDKCDLVQFEQSLDHLLRDLKHAVTTRVSIDELWDMFEKSFIQAINLSVPTKEIRNEKHLWLNYSIRRKSRNQKRLWKRFKQSGDNFLLQKYRSEQRKYRKSIQVAKNDYLETKVFAPLEQGNSKPFFRHIKSLKTNTSSIESLAQPNGELTENLPQITNLLNDFFQQQFCQSEQLLHVEQCENWAADITALGVLKLINDLKIKKAPGPDGINGNMLKLQPEKTADCLNIVFNESLRLGRVPTRWKEANVVPLHKKGDRTVPGNYRPISLTSIPCKIMEHIILHKLNSELDQIISTSQHGFRAGLSCETQLTSTIHSIAKALDRKVPTHALILDFKKAFDKVPHMFLINKLERYNLSPFLVDWIKHFLTGRTQRVTIKGVNSESRCVTSGVPQGSVLGPRLFLLYINDLSECVDCNISLFADDTIVYASIDNSFTVVDFQNSINAVFDWSQRWKLEFNVEKCKVMCFSGSACSDDQLPYFLNGGLLQFETHSLYLGVWLSSDLSWQYHIDCKVKKASQMLGFLRRSISSAPKALKLLAYKSFIRPILEYGCQVWDPYKRYEVDQVEAVQRKAVRFICNVKGRDIGVTGLIKDMNLETLEERRTNLRKCLLYKMIRDACSESPGAISHKFPELFSKNKNEDHCTTRSQRASQPMNLTANNNKYHNSFLPRTIRDMKLGDIYVIQ